MQYIDKVKANIFIPFITHYHKISYHLSMSQRPIKRKNMNVNEFDNELYNMRIQYENLNINNDSLSSKGINIKQ